MANNIGITTKLNLLLVLYTAGTLLFQPLASVIQVGVIIYLSIKKEWRYVIYGTILFICALVVSDAFFEHGAGQNKEFYLIALSISVFANLFWFAATIKQLKRMLYIDEDTIDESSK